MTDNEKTTGQMWLLEQQPTVKLSVFEWHEVLNAFERLLSVVNVATPRHKFLYEKIGTQLAAGVEVIVNSEDEA